MVLFVSLKTNRFLKYTATTNTQASFAKYRNFGSDYKSSRGDGGPAQPLLLQSAFLSVLSAL